MLSYKLRCVASLSHLMNALFMFFSFSDTIVCYSNVLLIKPHRAWLYLLKGSLLSQY